MLEADLEVGSVLGGKFRVERILGIGGMGVVVAATHLHLDKMVALKFMLDDVGLDELASSRFLREARAASRLQNAHIAKVLDVGVLDQGSPYMVMEYLEGTDLAQLMVTRQKAKLGPLRPYEAVLYVRDACEGISEAHALGIVHRDLKPSNLFLTKGINDQPLIKILDFGIAKAGFDGIQTQANAFLGSPVYMPPEQWQGPHDVDHRADIWAIGGILAYLVSGRPPFSAHSLPELRDAIMAGQGVSLAHLELPHQLQQLIAQCLQRDPDSRPQSATELANQLAAIDPWPTADLVENTETIVAIEKAAAAQRERLGPRDRRPPDGSSGARTTRIASATAAAGSAEQAHVGSSGISGETIQTDDNLREPADIAKAEDVSEPPDMTIEEDTTPSLRQAGNPNLDQQVCPTCSAVFGSAYDLCPDDGTMLIPGADPILGTTLAGKYVIDEPIGEGGMGRVYRAHHARLSKRTFAIKILLGDLAADPIMRKRFEQEAESASRLQHPNVVPVLDFGKTEGGLLYLVMEFVGGQSLSQLIKAGPLPEAQVVAITQSLCRGLAHAHSEGLVHRDFKPSNVVFSGQDQGGTPRILDFGLAIVRSAEEASVRLTGSGIMVGTPAYISPEQAQAAPVDRRTDLFALGISVYEMLAGRLPFSGDSMEVMFANTKFDAPAISERNPKVVVSPEMEAIVRKLMARDPDERFQSAGEVLALLGLLTASKESRTTDERLVSLLAAPPRDGIQTVRNGAALGVSDARTLERLLGDSNARGGSNVRPSNAGPGNAGGPGNATQESSNAGTVASLSDALTLERLSLGDTIATQGRSNAKTVVIAIAAVLLAALAVFALLKLASRDEARDQSAEFPEASMNNESDAAVPSQMLVEGGEQSDARADPAPRFGAIDATLKEPREPVKAPPAPPLAEIDDPPTSTNKRRVPKRPTSPELDTAQTIVQPIVDAGNDQVLTRTPDAPPSPKPAPPAPVVFDARTSIKTFNARGSLSSRIVRRAVDRALPDMRSCYKVASRQAKKNHGGGVSVSLQINELGRAANIKVSSFALSGLSQCISKSLRSVRTRVPPDVGTVSLSLTVNFAPLKQ